MRFQGPSAAANSFAVVSKRGRRNPQHTPATREEQLAQLRFEFADVYRELYEAAQAQRTLSGPRRLRHGSFEVAAEIFPVRHLSGDFFNVSGGSSSLLLAVADIMGKGLLAGMWFTHLLGLARACAEEAAEPAEAFALMNRRMCSGAWPPPLTSMFLARLDCLTGKLQYANAGHPAPVVLRSNRTRVFLAEGGPVLGALPKAEFRGAVVRLHPGDTLVAYSDGLLECRNQQDEEFGVERVIAEAEKSARESPTATLFSIIGAAQDFAGAHQREDDCTLMIVRRRPAACELKAVS